MRTSNSPPAAVVTENPSRALWVVPSGVTEPLILALYAAPELWAPVWLLCCFLRTEYFPIHQINSPSVYLPKKAGFQEMTTKHGKTKYSKKGEKL